MESRRGGGRGKSANTPHKMLLLPDTPINMLCNLKHKECYICTSVTKPLTKNRLQLLQVVNSVKFHLTSLSHKNNNWNIIGLIRMLLDSGKPSGKNVLCDLSDPESGWRSDYWSCLPLLQSLHVGWLSVDLNWLTSFHWVL